MRKYTHTVCLCILTYIHTHKLTLCHGESFGDGSRREARRRQGEEIKRSPCQGRQSYVIPYSMIGRQKNEENRGAHCKALISRSMQTELSFKSVSIIKERETNLYSSSKKISE